MSESNNPVNIDEALQQLSEKFLKGHENGQIKQKQGIVFIGNSRIGKSTISAFISGIKMHLVLKDKEFKIEPKQLSLKQKKNLIQHTLTSVTQFPNIYDPIINGKLFTVVDLPGFKDTSYEKELCNWHYIKSILQQLDKILFVMVMQVNNDTKNLQDFQLQMMQRFAQAFPCKNPHQAKNNLVTIINFMQNVENEKAEDIVKSEIKHNVQAQLQKLQLRDFYRKSFEHDRIFFMEKIKKKAASQKQIKDGSDYENPRLMEFIRKNTVLMEQTKHSTFKINLTKEMNQKSKNLRLILELITKKIFKSLSEKFIIYRNLFANLLTRLSETDGVICDKKDYQYLQQYHKKNNLKNYQKIGIYLGSLPEDTNKKEQEIVHEIVAHFHQISETSKLQADFTKKVQLCKEICLKFLSLVESLCSKLFKGINLDLIEEMSKNIKKSIYIDCHNLAYMYESVQNFPIQSDHVNDRNFQQHCRDQIVELYDKIRRISNFKDALNNYLSKILKSYEKLPTKKINFNHLQKFKQSCDITNLSALKIEIIIFIYKSLNKKLLSPENLSNHEAFYRILDEMNKQTLKNDEQQKLQAWKKTSHDWLYIRNKQSVEFLNILKSLKDKRKEVMEFYLKMDHSFEDLVELIKIFVEESDQQGSGKKKVFDICMRAVDHLAKHRQFALADQCCKLAVKIYLFEEKDYVIRAKMKSVQIKNLMMVPINQSQVQKQLQASPWTNISDGDFQWLLALIKDSKELIEQQKRELTETELIKIVSTQSNKSIEKERSSFLNQQESPIKTHVSSPEVVKEEEKKPRVIIKRPLNV